jgi:hypothetical protein
MRGRLAVIAVAALCAACGGGRGAPAARQRVSVAAPPSPATTTTLTTSTLTTSSRPKPRARPAPKVNPGSLPQTDQLPSAATPQFHAEMEALWSGVVGDSLSAALPAFFPEAAYVQVKGIADPRADYVERLLAEYRLDLAAAHALLGSSPRSARLLAVRVPESYAHWVAPGTCYNTVGYFEVPNARVVYQQGGQVRSFGIASMISWRGVWYVVHLGAVLRPSATGVVDQPSLGTGESAPSSTC